MAELILDDMVDEINEDIQKGKVKFDRKPHRAVEEQVLEGKKVKVYHGSILVHTKDGD